MSNGIAHNNLNDISKIYLDTISGINKKEQSDDVKRWQNEETEGKKESPFKKKKNKDLPFTDDVSETKYQREAFSNWRTDLREVTSDAEATEIDNQPEIKEKKVKNKIKINPEFKEAVKEMGGELLEVKEVDAPDAPTKDDKKEEQDEAKKKKIADKERKLKMRILRVKMMATKQDAGASIVAGYEPHVSAIKKLVNERLGGKGYKSYTSSTGKKVSGDWEDSDRGAGNKATKRAGGKVDKKSPTYLAHVKNKKGHDCASKVKHEEYGIGDCISEMHDLDENGKVAHYDVEFEKYIVENVPVEELEILEGSMHEHVIREEDKKGSGSGTKDACYKKVKASAKVWPSAYASGRLVQCRKKGAANYGNSKKESYSWRDDFEFVEEQKEKKKKNCGCGKDPCITYGKQDVKEAKSAAWQRKEGKRESGGLNQKGVDSYRAANPGSKLKTAVTTKPSKLKKGSKSANRRKSFCARMSGMKKKLTSSKTANDPDSRINKSLRKWNCSYEPEGTPIMEKDSALDFVKKQIEKKHGKGAIYDGKSKSKSSSPAEKAKASAERKKRQDADNKAYASRAKKAGFKSTQDYTNVVARYGSEDNYRKGKGLGT